MTYELAQRLKDAGFPQHEDKFPSAGMFAKGVYQPTLSELIEACGKEFIALERFDTRWETYRRTEGPVFDLFAASTPEEAVAKLWLALNKKP